MCVYTSVCLCANVIVYIAARVSACPLHRSPTLFKLSVRVWGLILLFTQALEQQRHPHLSVEAGKSRRKRGEGEAEEEDAELTER